MRPSWSSLLGGCLGGGGAAAAAAGVTVPFTDQDLPPGSSSDPDCLRVFTFAELSAAAGGFRSRINLICVGVLGSVYKAALVVDDDGGEGVTPARQAVAMRVIDRRVAAQRREEPLEEAIFLLSKIELQLLDDDDRVG